MPLDPAAIAAASPVSYRGRAYRHQAPGYDPLIGEGARINGGRFNPPDSFPVLYLCQTRACTVAELQRLGQRNVIGVAGLLPRVLYEYDIDLETVLDLTSADVRHQVGVSETILVHSDWAACQEIGEAAHRAGFQAITAPSATGVDNVLAVFPELTGSRGRIEAHLSEEWTTTADL